MKSKADLVDIVWSGPMPSHHEGFVLGNGDLGALMFGNQAVWKMIF